MQSLARDLDRLTPKAAAAQAQALKSSDQVIADLEQLKSQIEAEGLSAVNASVPALIARTKSAADAALASNKEYYSAYSKFQKGVEKKFNQTVLPLLGSAEGISAPEAGPSGTSRPFTHDDAQRALNKVIAMHLIRQGRFEVAETFMAEAGVRVPPRDLGHARDLHRILGAIRRGDLSAALQWAQENAEWLEARQSPLHFDLHRSRFVKLLTEPQLSVDGIVDGDATMAPAEGINGTGGPFRPPPLTSAESTARTNALAYGQTHFRAFHNTRWPEIVRLMSSVLFIPLRRLRSSPYADLYNPSRAALDGDTSPWLHHAHLLPLFTAEYSAWLGWSRELPLVVATEMGSGGALAKLAKVRSVMKEKGTEWSQADELPVEIALPTEYRFHSVFACPVSKEQATDENPPMRQPCGHVIAKESLTKLAKGGGTVKCPYCPSSALSSSAMRVYF